MDPVIIFGLLGIVLAAGLFFTLCGPVYVGLWTSLYWIYQDDTEKLAKVHAIKYDSDRVMEQYSELYHYWQANHEKLDFYSFTLPLFALPAFGALVSVILTIIFVRYVRNMFRV
jgi:hypothetical protein